MEEGAFKILKDKQVKKSTRTPRHTWKDNMSIYLKEVPVGVNTKNRKGLLERSCE